VQANIDDPHLWDMGRPRELTLYDLRNRLASIKKAILTAGGFTSPAIQNAEIVAVDFFEPSTCVRASQHGPAVIGIDLELVRFIGLMNEALTNDSSDSQSQNLRVANVLVFYAVTTKPPGPKWCHAFAPPKPPEPFSEHSLIAVASQTILHTAFVIAHELAHLALGHVTEPRVPCEPAAPSEGLAFVLSWGCAREVREELQAEAEADAMAIRICLAAFHAEDKEQCQQLLTSVFQLSRYFLWLDAIVSRREEQLAAARHYALRDTLKSYYRRVQDPAFLVLHSVWLEEHAEVGWVAAAKHYKDML